MSDEAQSESSPPTRKPTKYRPMQLQYGDYKPEGAMRMSREEVVNMQRMMLSNWRPKSDVWPFRWGGFIVSLASGFTGVLVNSHFRNKFLLRNYGIYQTYLPVVLFPTLTSIATQMYIQNSVLTVSDCPTCVCVRGGVLQVLCSTAYSVGLAPVVCILMSKQFHTYVLPKHSFQPNVRHALKTKPSAWYCFLGLIAFNFGVGYLTAHMQGSTLDTITIKDAKKTAERLMLK